MRSRFLLVSVAVIAVSTAAPLYTMRASAAVESTVLTPAQTRALFGDELSVTYFDGTDYQTGVLTYLTSSVELDEGQPDFGYSSYYSDLWSSLAPSGTRYIVYSANDLNIQANAQYQITLEPQISFSNTLITKFVAGVSCSANYTAQPRYSPYNYVSYYVNGNSFSTSAFQYGASPTVSMPYWSVVRFLIGSGQYQQARTFIMYPVAYNQETYATLNQFCFTADSSAAPASNICRFIVSCPTISINTSTDSGGGQTGTDLTSTNMKLDQIISILSLMANQEQQQNQQYFDTVNSSDQQQQQAAQGDFDTDYDTAIGQQSYIDSVVNHNGLASINFSDNSYPVDAAFNGLWNDSRGQTNPLVLGMCLIPITIAVISYVLFGKKI